MLNNIIRFSLNNRLAVIAVATMLTVAGFFASQKAEVDVFPDLNAPTVVVMTEANGMATEEVEQLVTLPIETALNGATGVRRVRSSSTSGFSVVWVEFDWDTNIYIARQTVSEKLSAINQQLPPNIGRPTIGPQSSILGELLIIGLTADKTSMFDLRTIADWTIRQRLLAIKGVAQVAVLGGDTKEYQILFDPGKMKHYGVTLQEVTDVVNNMNSNVAGGVINQYGNEYIVRAMLSTTAIDELSRSVVKTVDGSPICLADIAKIQIGAQEPRLGTASERGKPAVLLTVTKQPGANTIELTQQIENALAETKQNLPEDIHISTDAFKQSRFIDSSIDNVTTSLLEGALFVVIILALFLANVRTTIISLVTIPLSLLVTILILNRFGITLNTMSLGGMAIAIGSLVDDAIVDVENVWRRLQVAALPVDKIKIIYEASREVRMPILNSTLIIMASFLPLFFLSGMEGRMLIPLGIAFVTALLASTIVALTLTPVMCSYLLAPRPTMPGRHTSKESPIVVWLKKHYSVALIFVLGHKKTVVATTTVILVATTALFFTLGRNFLPPFNEGSLTINISTLPGVSLEESDKIGRRAEELLLSVPEINTVVRKTGRAELDEHALGVNVSEIEAPFTLDKRSHTEVINEIRHKLTVIPGANIEIGQPISHRIDAMLSGTKANIAIKVFGPNLNRLYSLGNQIKEAVENVEGIADLNVEQLVERPELKITPNRELLARQGISLPEFGDFITANLAGLTVGQVNDNGKTFNLVLRSDAQKRSSIETVADLFIDTKDGRKIPLCDVATITSSAGPNTINRENVSRRIVVSANCNGRDLGSVVDDIKKQIGDNIVLPEGYHIEYGGQFESEQAASHTLMLVSIVSIVIIFLLLNSQFRNLRESAIILLNLPLALIGGILTLVITSGELSIPAIIGFISLFGIATRNGMLLISQYNQLQRDNGLSLRDSIVRGSLERMNPIVMTALTSALALIPLALRGDLPGNEIQSPMAKVILGGLLSSTLLNAFIIPIVYEWIHSSKNNSKS
ncbi:MAG: efflux RND transporter permease subunit [Prevotellaceae bacterium]|nr:efflux RND transporter permease subunit [Prevotellaceae bacterium]